MNKFVFLFSLCILFFSCSNSQNSKLIYNEENTIKSVVFEKGKSVFWADELENNRLAEKIILSDKKLVDNSVSLSQEVLKVINYQKKLFPEIDGFGSLDVSELDTSIYDSVNRLCKEISVNFFSVEKSFFVDKYYFNYVLFQNDLQQGWKNTFKERFPAEKKIDTKDISLTKDLFNSWYIGEPYIDNAIIQLPVRLINSKGYVDINLFISKNSENKIYQICITRWGI